jgi:Holliday junction resolvase
VTSQYARGTRFEHDVRDDLRACGYEVVRSAGSKTVVDLIAIKQGQLLFLQCKLSPASFVTRTSWNTLFKWAAWVDALPILAYKHVGKKLPCYERIVGQRDPRMKGAAVRWTPDEIGRPV